MKIAKQIHTIRTIKARKSPYMQYKVGFANGMTDWSLKNAKKAQTKVFEYLEQGRSLDVVKAIYKEQFESDILNARKVSVKYTRPLYEYRKTRFKIRKAEPEYTDTITATDKRTIKLLTDADMLWVLEYANDSQIAIDTIRVLTESMQAGNTMQESANVLKDYFDSFPPAEFNARFGSESYWRLVTHNNTHRIKAYANINDMEFAGITEYEWKTRGAEACPICQPMDGQVYKVEDAKARMNDYFNAVELGNITRMKEADPFLTVEDVQIPEALVGVMPPLHHYCYCEIVVGD